MKWIFLLLSIILVSCILDAEAVNYNVTITEPVIQSNEFTSSSFNHTIIEKDKQIANLSGQVEALHSVEIQSLTIGILGTISGIGALVIECVKHKREIRNWINNRKANPQDMNEPNIKRNDWVLVAISVAVGTVITITYDFLSPCLEGVFNPQIHNITCDPNSYAKVVAGFIAFIVGFGYLLLFRLSYRNKRKHDTNPDT